MTDIKVSIENGLQRIGRFQKRPSIKHLEPNLFQSGPLPGEIIEVCGETSVGKTLLLIDLIKKCILPKRHEDIIIGGFEAEVLFLNTDMHFSVMKLIKLMSVYLQYCFPKEYESREYIIDEIIKNSLKKCIILNVFNSEVLRTTFHLIQRLLASNNQISLLMIDSISAFYWQDRKADGARKMDLYIMNILRRLHQCIYPFKVTVIFTRPAYFQTKSNIASECSPNYDLRNINMSIHLKPFHRESSSSHRAEVRTPTAFFVKFYTIEERGILWSL